MCCSSVSTKCTRSMRRSGSSHLVATTGACSMRARIRFRSSSWRRKLRELEEGGQQIALFTKRGEIVSKKERLVRVRMTTNSTAARAGQVVERQEAEAKRLIAAGQAEPYEPVEYVPKADFD